MRSVESIEEVARRYTDLEPFPGKPGWFMARCPLCDDDDSSFYIFPDGSDGRFECYDCGAKGDAQDLARLCGDHEVTFGDRVLLAPNGNRNGPEEQGVPVPVPLYWDEYGYTSENGSMTAREVTVRERPRLRAVRFSEMDDPEPRRYLLEGLIPEFYPTLLYGDGGVAKSLIALSIGMDVARGSGSWLGHTLKGGRALYLDFELDEAEQNRRIRRLAAAEGLSKPPDGLLYMSALGHKPKQAFEDALSECGTHEVKLIIVDSLGPAMEGDMEAARDVIGFFQERLEPFRAAGVTVLAVDHQPKPQAGERYQSKRAFGSVFKGNLARSVVQVEAGERAEGTLSVRLRQNKHNFGPKAEPFGIKLTFSEERIALDLEDIDAFEQAAEETLNASERVLLSLVGGPAYPDEIAETTHLARQTVKNTLSKLRNKSLVEPTGKRDRHNAEQVRLTEAGKQRRTRTHTYKGVQVQVHRHNAHDESDELGPNERLWQERKAERERCTGRADCLCEECLPA